jgi:hypothetical protein
MRPWDPLPGVSEETSLDRFAARLTRGHVVPGAYLVASGPTQSTAVDTQLNALASDQETLIRELYHLVLDRYLDTRPTYDLQAHRVVVGSSLYTGLPLSTEDYDATVATVPYSTVVAVPPAFGVAEASFIALSPHLRPDFRTHTLSELERLGRLTAGWDGYRAPAIDAAVITAARALVLRLPHDLAPPLRVVPLASGGLQFEWASGQVALELEFETADTIRYLTWNPSHGAAEEDVVSAADIARIEALIRWYAQQNV